MTTEATADGTDTESITVSGKIETRIIPAMPMPAAVICFVLNLLIPGVGTITAGVSQLVCGRDEDYAHRSRLASCYTNFVIGLLQLVTTAILLIGWVWSCVWGVFFILVSAENSHNRVTDASYGSNDPAIHGRIPEPESMTKMAYYMPTN